MTWTIFFSSSLRGTFNNGKLLGSFFIAELFYIDFQNSLYYYSLYRKL